jgi:hypothetical protein
VASGTNITLASTTAGADIYYTTDGSNPATSSAKYAAPFAVTPPVTVKAIAVKDGLANSGILTAAYTLAAPASFAGIDLDIAINRADNPGNTQFTFVVTPAGADSYQVKKAGANAAASTTNKVNVPASVLSATAVTQLDVTATKGGGTSNAAAMPGMIKYAGGSASTQAGQDWGRFLVATLDVLQTAVPSAYTPAIATTNSDIQASGNIVGSGAMAIAAANTATAAVMSNWAAILEFLNSHQEAAAEYNPIISGTMPRLWFNQVSSADMAANVQAWLRANGYPRVSIQ